MFCQYVISGCDFWMQLRGEKGKRDAELVEIIMLISGFYSF